MQADYSIAAAQNLFVFIRSLYPNQKSDADIWNMIQITPMIGVNAEQFTLADAATLSAFAKQKGLGGLSMWSVSRDQPCADKWASPVCSGNNLESGSYEFAKRFLG